MYFHECVEARRVRTDPRWDACVGDGGAKPGSIARVCHSPDQLVDVEPAERGQYDDNDSEDDCRDGSCGEVWRRWSSDSATVG
jgi:hypothetical protein